MINACSWTALDVIGLSFLIAVGTTSFIISVDRWLARRRAWRRLSALITLRTAVDSLKRLATRMPTPEIDQINAAAVRIHEALEDFGA